MSIARIFRSSMMVVVENPRKKNIFAFNFVYSTRFLLFGYNWIFVDARALWTPISVWESKKKHEKHLFFSHRFIKCSRTNENNEITNFNNIVAAITCTSCEQNEWENMRYSINENAASVYGFASDTFFVSYEHLRCWSGSKACRNVHFTEDREARFIIYVFCAKSSQHSGS